jgi:hypothetical protein
MENGAQTLLERHFEVLNDSINSEEYMVKMWNDREMF